MSAANAAAVAAAKCLFGPNQSLKSNVQHTKKKTTNSLQFGFSFWVTSNHYKTNCEHVFMFFVAFFISFLCNTLDAMILHKCNLVNLKALSMRCVHQFNHGQWFLKQHLFFSSSSFFFLSKLNVTVQLLLLHISVYFGV